MIECRCPDCGEAFRAEPVNAHRLLCGDSRSDAELSPAYCDVTVLRWQRYAGRQAVRDGDGARFDDLAAQQDRSAAA